MQVSRLVANSWSSAQVVRAAESPSAGQQQPPGVCVHSRGSPCPCQTSGVSCDFGHLDGAPGPQKCGAQQPTQGAVAASQRRYAQMARSPSSTTRAVPRSRPARHCSTTGRTHREPPEATASHVAATPPHVPTTDVWPPGSAWQQFSSPRSERAHEHCPGRRLPHAFAGASGYHRRPPCPTEPCRTGRSIVPGDALQPQRTCALQRCRLVDGGGTLSCPADRVTLPIVSWLLDRQSPDGG